MKKIGERIRRIRVSKDYTQENLAEELGMTKSAFSKIERGETDANVSRLLRIAEILEVNVCDFFEEQPRIAQFHDQQNPYGYASKQEVEQLSRSIQALLREIEKMKLELQQSKPAKKSRKK